MCKSKVEGGQRCAGHAWERLRRASEYRAGLLQAPVDDNTYRVAVQRAGALYTEAAVDVASTVEGAKVFREALDKARATADPNDAKQAEHLRWQEDVIDDGARTAQANLRRENEYRAMKGLPPLTREVPKTFEQEAEEKAQQEKVRAAETARKADPLGLLAERARALRSKARPTPAKAAAAMSAVRESLPDPKVVHLRETYFGAGEVGSPEWVQAAEAYAQTEEGYNALNAEQKRARDYLNSVDPRSIDEETGNPNPLIFTSPRKQFAYRAARKRWESLHAAFWSGHQAHLDRAAEARARRSALPR